MRERLSCEDIKPIISAYYDKELSAEEMLNAEKHFEICSECRKELNNLKKLSTLIHKNLKNSEYINFTPEQIAAASLHEEKMDCNKVLKELSAYYDGEVSLKLHYLIEEHLLECNDCQKAFIDLTASTDKVKKYFEISRSLQSEDKNHIVDSVMLRLEKNTKFKKIASAATAGIFVATVGWFVIGSVTSNLMKDTYNHNNAVKNPDDPVYVNAQDFLINKDNKTPYKKVHKK